MFLMIDNYDSFVYNLVRYIKELNQEIMVIRNDKITIEEIEELKPEGIIISPGPKRPEDAGISIDVVKRFGGQIPILGICLGHQVIGRVFGAKIIEGEEPVHGKVSSIFHNGQGLYDGLSIPFDATRYHSLMIDSSTINNDLVITSYTEDGVIMGIRHARYMIEGVQFHPEAELTEYGHALLKNFVRTCKEYNGNYYKRSSNETKCI
jgi:para-aminobenzoate synthetase component 2